MLCREMVLASPCSYRKAHVLHAAHTQISNSFDHGSTISNDLPALYTQAAPFLCNPAV